MDAHYQSLPESGELEHGYGSHVHLLSRPYLMTNLARFCSEAVGRSESIDLLRLLFEHLISAVVDREFPRAKQTVRTRMAAQEPRGVYEGQLVSPETKVVCASLLRAGSIPTQTAFESLTRMLAAENLRQDFLVLERRTENGKVIGVDFQGSKIAGSVSHRTLLVADPMGATGGTLLEALRHYSTSGQGDPDRVISVQLIVTPEFIQRVHAERPETRIYAIRLDRGLSDESALQKFPGSQVPGERGLNKHQYIVPGAGGVGEFLNNTEQ